MSRLLTSRALRLPFLGDLVIETYSARPAGVWVETWAEGRTRLAWIGRRLILVSH